MDIEAVVLTGGQSRRMGKDKATLPIEGVPQAERIVRQLKDAGIAVTSLGREPTAGASFLRDESEFKGPLAALARFSPTRELVFVASCDLPLFDAALVKALAEKLEGHEAAVPVVGGWRQPLCALFRRSAWLKLGKIASMDSQCAMEWLDMLDARLVTEEELATAGLDPAVAAGANTLAELEQALSRQRH